MRRQEKLDKQMARKPVAWSEVPSLPMVLVEEYAAELSALPMVELTADPLANVFRNIDLSAPGYCLGVWRDQWFLINTEGYDSARYAVGLTAAAMRILRQAEMSKTYGEDMVALAFTLRTAAEEVCGDAAVDELLECEQALVFYAQVGEVDKIRVRITKA